MKRSSTTGPLVQRRGGLSLSAPQTFLILLGASVLGAGCTSKYVTDFTPPTNVVSEVSPDIRSYPLRNIAVIPFRNNTNSPDAGNKLAQFFYTELLSHNRHNVTPPVRLEESEEVELEFRVDPSRRAGTVNREANLEVLERAVSRFLNQVQPYTTTRELVFPGEHPEIDPGAEPEEALAGEYRFPEVTAGEAEGGIDAVVTGVIARYENRDGSPIAADSPPSVAFDVYLLSAKDGKVIWYVSFDETQEPLSENLLKIGRFFRGGGIWQSNDTLSRLGMERVMQTFPGIEEEAPTAASEPLGP